MPALRIGIVGASSLRGQELATALRERHFPALPPRLLQLPPGAAAAAAGGTHALVAFDDEAAVADPLTPEAVAALDLLFLAADAERAWAVVEPQQVSVVDLTGTLAGVPGAHLAGIEPLPAADAVPPRLTVVAHPAAQALALLLARLARVGRIALAAATVFEPASERDLAGLQELEQQTLRLLAVQSQPSAVYDAQVAFNLRAALGPAAQPGLGTLRQRLLEQLEQLRQAEEGDWPLPALELLQAPLFHASVVSLYVRYATPPPASAVQAALASPWLATSAEYPDVVAAAGADAIQLGPLRTETSSAEGMWLFATLDNLRRAAFSAVDAAQAAWAGRT